MRTKSYAWDSPTARSLTKGYAMAKFAIQGAGDAKVSFSNKKVKNTLVFFKKKISSALWRDAAWGCSWTKRSQKMRRNAWWVSIRLQGYFLVVKEYCMNFDCIIYDIGALQTH